jgi:hypothetical protein
MSWLLKKIDAESLKNNKESDMMDVILKLLQKCTRHYTIQIFDGWLAKVFYRIIKLYIFNSGW